MARTLCLGLCALCIVDPALPSGALAQPLYPDPPQISSSGVALSYRPIAFVTIACPTEQTEDEDVLSQMGMSTSHSLAT